MGQGRRQGPRWKLASWDGAAYGCGPEGEGGAGLQAAGHDCCWAMAFPLGQEQPAVVRQDLVLPCSRGKEGARQAMNRVP